LYGISGRCLAGRPLPDGQRAEALPPGQGGRCLGTRPRQTALLRELLGVTRVWKVGQRVARDKGDGQRLGTVVEVTEKIIKVKWETGRVGEYRIDQVMWLKPA
jgi:hypothetical protein